MCEGSGSEVFAMWGRNTTHSHSLSPIEQSVPVLPPGAHPPSHTLSKILDTRLDTTSWGLRAASSAADGLLTKSGSAAEYMRGMCGNCTLCHPHHVCNFCNPWSSFISLLCTVLPPAATRAVRSGVAAPRAESPPRANWATRAAAESEGVGVRGAGASSSSAPSAAGGAGGVVLSRPRVARRLGRT